MGNIQSVKNSLDYLNIPNDVISKPKKLHTFDKIILPGVGAFGEAMKKLNDLGYTKEIKKFAQQKKPVLGICLGMQLLFDESEEHGNHKGLGLIKGRVLPFNKKVKNLPIPLVGWSNTIKEKGSPLLKDMPDDSSFYFVHSFYCDPEDKNIVISSADYGIKFTAIIHKDNIFGCQFHPEKSQKDGLKLLENFNKI